MDFKEGELVKTHAGPKADHHYMQVGIRRDLYMVEKTFDKTAGFGMLRTDLTLFAPVLVGEIFYWEE